MPQTSLVNGGAGVRRTPPSRVPTTAHTAQPGHPKQLSANKKGLPLELDKPQVQRDIAAEAIGFLYSLEADLVPIPESICGFNWPNQPAPPKVFS